MSNLAIQTEQEALRKQNQELSLEAQVFLSFKHRTPNRYKLLDKLIRANINPEEELTDKTIYLGEKAKKLLRAILKKIFSDGHALLNHKYITQVTRCKSDQNIIILKELETLLSIQYYRLYTNDQGVKFSRYYYIKLHPAIAEELKDTGTLNSEFYAEKNRRTYTNRNIFNKDKNIDLGSEFFLITKKIENEENPSSEAVTFQKEIAKPTKLKKCLPNERKKTTNAQAKARIYKPFAYTKPKTLGEMLLLIDHAMCNELRSISGREFSDNFITQLVLKMSKDSKITARFEYRKGFIAYMGRALRYEKHDAVKTGNINFRLKVNIPLNDNEQKERKKPLEPVELPEGAWGEICGKLIGIYDEYVYRNWLSKLKAFIEEDGRSMRLEAQSSFILGWIETNYGGDIRKVIEGTGLEFKGFKLENVLEERVIISCKCDIKSTKGVIDVRGEHSLNGFQKISTLDIFKKLQINE